MLSEYFKPFSLPELRDMHECAVTMNVLALTPEEFKQFSKIKKILHAIFSPLRSDHKNKIKKNLSALKQNLLIFSERRNEFANKFPTETGCLKMLSKYKQGNCYETAHVAKLLLQLNGIKNAKVVYMFNDNRTIDHAFCIFNKNGQPFDGRLIKRNSIIIDPWCQKADFAENMFIYYRNMMQQYFHTGNPKTLILKEFNNDIKLTAEDIQAIKKEYPHFILKPENCPKSE